MRAQKPLLLASSNIIAAPYIGHLSAYANTLTRLIPDLYAALDVVSRELVGYIPSVFRNVSAERAAVGEEIVYPVTNVTGLFNVTPAMAVPEPADKTVGNAVIKITKSQGAEFGWTGEEQKGLNNGAGLLTVQGDLFAQGLRALVNAIEADLAIEAAAHASRAFGTVGTVPFTTNLAESAQVRKILDDNGAPASGRSLIIDTGIGASLRTLQNLTRVNEAGTTMTLRDGELLNLTGLSIKESAQVQTITGGTAAGATTNNAGYAIGATVITLAAAGTGTIPAGSTITFTGDTNKYQVALGDADVSNGGSITLRAPGLRKAIPAVATNITMIATHVAATAFSQNALHLVARAPALPQGGDLAMDRYVLTDPRSGMAFEVALYPGYRKIRAEVVCAWGVAATKDEHIAMLLY